ncbi:MAG: VOC family protein [Pseudomonadota bacterium]
MVMRAGKNAIDIGILVNDIEKSLAFYQGLLGLEKIQEMPVPFGTMHRLAFGDSFVKLIDPTKVPPAGADGLTKALGFRYLTFQVANIGEICDACEKAGIQFEIPKQELMPGVTIAMVKDPDQNVVEFVERA